MSKPKKKPAKDNKNPEVLKPGKEVTVTLQQNEDHTLKVINPNGAQIKCTADAGEGDVSLYKNGVRLTKLENTYFLSTNPGYPSTVHLNTSLTSPEDDIERNNTEITFDKEKLAAQYSVPQKEITESYLKQKLGRQYGVPKTSIEVITSPKNGKKKFVVPDSVWEVYFVAYGSDENRFKVKLLPKED